MLKIILILFFISFTILDFILVCGPSIIKMQKENSKNNTTSSIDKNEIK